MILQLQVGAEVKTITLDRDGESYRAQIDDRLYRITQAARHADEILFTINDQRQAAIIAADRSKYFVALDGDVLELAKPDARQARRGKVQHGEDKLAASMPGQVTKVLVDEGDAIARGQILMVLEAMKMEIKITAPQAGRVVKLQVKLGQVVDRGQTLIELAE